MRGGLGWAIGLVAVWMASGCYDGVASHTGGWDGIGGVDPATTGTDDSDTAGGDDAPPADLEPAPATIHRLTNAQLHNTYLALLGEPLSLPTELPPDDQLYGFTSIAAAGATISPLAAEQYENATYNVLDQVWSDPQRRAALVGCEPTDVSDPCVTAFLERFAHSAWRRPVEASEVSALVALTGSVATQLGDANEALEFGAAAVLQSPSFLFRIEVGEPVPGAPKLLRYTSWEMASRLSYLLTNSPPDDELMALADADELRSVDAVEEQAVRLLEDPRARASLVGFFRDFMNIAKLDELDRSAEQFPQMSATLGVSMRLELEHVFEATMFDESGDFRELFTTRSTFLNEELAGLYGVEGIFGDEMRPYRFDAEARRAGILTSAAFLAGNAHKTQTSPTHRGRFVRIQLLCQDVPPPPEGVDTSLPPPDPNAEPQTLRERLERHREDDACRSCHQLMDPIGFAFENYDPMGVYRDVDEQGLPIDSVTEVDGTAITTPSELGDFLAELPQAGACVAQRFYEHAGAHTTEPGERDAVNALVDEFVASDYDFRSLVVAMVVNDGFRYATVEEG